MKRSDFESMSADEMWTLHEEITAELAAKIRAEKRAQLEPRLLEALDTPAEKRTEEQKLLAKGAMERVHPTWDETQSVPRSSSGM